MILSVQSFSLDAFKKQILLNENNMWAVVEFFVQELSKQENGHYILLKDPVKGFIRIYKVPESEVPTMESAQQTVSEEKSEEYSEEYSEYSEYSDYSEYSYSDEKCCVCKKQKAKLTINTLWNTMRISDTCTRHRFLCDRDCLDKRHRKDTDLLLIERIPCKVHISFDQCVQCIVATHSNTLTYSLRQKSKQQTRMELCASLTHDNIPWNYLFPISSTTYKNDTPSILLDSEIFGI